MRSFGSASFKGTVSGSFSEKSSTTDMYAEGKLSRPCLEFLSTCLVFYVYERPDMRLLFEVLDSWRASMFLIGKMLQRMNGKVGEKVYARSLKILVAVK